MGNERITGPIMGTPKSTKTKRREANRLILEKLQKAIESFPDQRFGQMLINFDLVREIRGKEGQLLGFHNVFNVESEEMLKAMDESPLGLFLAGKLK